jgi:GNAT superfamily N-acetyltransferase
MGVLIRLAIENDLVELVELYNEVTLDLHRKGINQWDYPWDFNKIRKEIISKTLFVLELNEELIGTFSICHIEELANLKLQERCYYLAKIALLPKCQGSGFGAQIIQFASAKANEAEVSLYLDCWAGNEKLKKFYLKTGFVLIGDFPENDYYISIFKY